MEKKLNKVSHGARKDILRCPYFVLIHSRLCNTFPRILYKCNVGSGDSSLLSVVDVVKVDGGIVAGKHAWATQTELGEETNITHVTGTENRFCLVLSLGVLQVGRVGVP